MTHMMQVQDFAHLDVKQDGTETYVKNYIQETVKIIYMIKSLVFVHLDVKQDGMETHVI